VSYEYSRTCVQGPPLGLKKVAVVQKVIVINGVFLSILENFGSGCSLLTGGHCYEMIVSIGFTVRIYLFIKARLG
jgi:hypothetical protein